MIKIYLTKKIDGQELPVTDFKIGLNVGQRGKDAVVPEGTVIDPYYVHTDNNYTDAAVAEVAKIAGKANISDVYTKSETYTQTEINNKLSAVYKFKGSVLTYDLLPTVHENGDTWNVINGITPELNGMNYAWSDSLGAWDAIGGVVGLATLTENGLLSKEDFAIIRNLSATYAPIIHDHLEQTIKPDVVEYQSTPTVPTAQGSQYWDETYKVLSTVLGDGVVLQNGLEIYVRIVNKTGVQINDGQVVYINGAQGNRPTAALAMADTATSSNVIGVATQNIAINGEGFVTVFGNVSGFNTTQFADGGNVYLSANVAGGVVATAPDYPNHKVIVATALNSTVNGQIFVRPNHILELAELHGVDLTETTPLATDSVLIEQTSTGKVKKSLFSTIVTFFSSTFAKLSGGNTFSGTQNFSNTIQHIVGEFLYDCASFTADTVNDRRYSNVAGVYKNERCTVANATTKGGGTWVVDFIVLANGRVGIGKINPSHLLDVEGAINCLVGYVIGSNQVGFFSDNFSVNKDFKFRWSRTLNSFDTKDVGIYSPVAGLLQIYDGVTLGTTFRDLALRMINKTGYDYFAASATADTVNDTRSYNNAGVMIYEVCTVANATTKGGGTWKEILRIGDLGTAPSSATAIGKKGEIRYTSDYIYVCVATNTWKRTLLETW